MNHFFHMVVLNFNTWSQLFKKKLCYFCITNTKLDYIFTKSVHLKPNALLILHMKIYAHIDQDGAEIVAACTSSWFKYHCCA